MRPVTLFLVLLSSALLTVGCAQRQEEATQLQKEMMAQEGESESTRVSDTVVDSAYLQGSDLDAQSTVSVTTPAEPVEVEYETAPQVEPAPDTAELPREPNIIPDIDTARGYTVQVAATDDMTYAQKLEQRYQSKGYEAFISTSIKDGVTFYRIRIGKYATRGEAERLRLELKDKQAVDGWVDRIEP